MDDLLLSMIKPKLYAGPNGVEVRFIRDFEQTCVLLQQHVPKDPKKMTVLEFYQALETVQEQIKQQKRKHG